MAAFSVLTISDSGIDVQIEPRGASLVQITYDGHDYCPEFSETERLNRYVGSVIAPWANRIADGRYTFHGNSFQLPINETARHNALHGFAGRELWQVGNHSQNSVRLTHRVEPTEGYPHQVELTVDYLVEDSRIVLRARAVVTSDSEAPFGWAFHPYFRLGDGAPREWEIFSGASAVMDVDAERLLPTGLIDLTGHRLDYRHAHAPDVGLIDHAFTRFGQTHPPFRVFDPQSSRQLSLDWSENLPWMQLHVPQVDDEVTGSVVVEPQTSPPDSFNSGEGLQILAPQEEWTAWISIILNER